MLQDKIIVAPFLELEVIRTRRRFRGLMPRNRIFVETVIGREVETAAEPPDRIRTVGAEEPHVHVRRRAIRIKRVMDDGNTHRPEALTGEIRARQCRRGGQSMPTHIGKRDPTFLQHRTTSDDARPTTTAFGPLPFVRVVFRLPVDFLHERAEAILQP